MPVPQLLALSQDLCWCLDSWPYWNCERKQSRIDGYPCGDPSTSMWRLSGILNSRLLSQKPCEMQSVILWWFRPASPTLRVLKLRALHSQAISSQFTYIWGLTVCSGLSEGLSRWTLAVLSPSHTRDRAVQSSTQQHSSNTHSPLWVALLVSTHLCQTVRLVYFHTWLFHLA